MRALLLKDLDVMKRGSRTYIVLLLIFSIIPMSGFAGFALVYASMLPYQAFAYDERSKWDTLAAMMPYSSRDLVLSKYVLGWISIGIAGLFAAFSRLVQLLAGRPDALSELISVLPIAGLSLLIMGCTLPLVCRFGVEKGRLLFMGIIALSAILLVSGMTILDTGSSSSDSLIMTVLLILTILGVVAQPISIFIAGKLYRKRFYEGAGA